MVDAVKGDPDAPFQPLVALFVYGILRPDYAGPTEPGIYNVDRDTRTPGCIHFVMKSMGYPVAFFGNDPDHTSCGAGDVVGDILWVDPTSDWYVTNRAMEEHAGYRVVSIKATLADGDIVEAEAFHYTGWACGERIASGDWLAAVRAY